MASYIIGDIQGCFNTFCKLLDHLNFNEKNDTLYLLGDVINKGEDSLKILRFIKDNESCVKMILGNHEIFALANYYKAISSAKKHTMQELFDAEDAPILFDFLRKQPLIISIDKNILVHAGILPSFSIEQALDLAKEIEKIIASDDMNDFINDFFNHIVGEHKPTMTHHDLLKLALFSFIHMRMCLSPHKMDMGKFSGRIEEAPKGLTPWFFLRQDKDFQIFFGHWSAIGFSAYKNFFALDSGCIWGKFLTAYHLESKKIFQVKNCETSAASY